jgi:hypothetical protein
MDADSICQFCTRLSNDETISKTVLNNVLAKRPELPKPIMPNSENIVFDTPPKEIKTPHGVIWMSNFTTSLAKHENVKLPATIVMSNDKDNLRYTYGYVRDEVVIHKTLEGVNTTTIEAQAYAPYRGSDDQLYFMTVRTELPVLPTPPVFLQPRKFCMPPLGADGRSVKAATGGLIWMVFDWRDKGPIGGEEEDEYPVCLYDILRPHSPWNAPTETQLVDLLTKVVAETDYLAKPLYFLPSLNSIYITNPSKLGGEKPLSFKFCPFALGMENELPKKEFKQLLHRRLISTLLLQVSTRIFDLSDPNLAQVLPKAFNKYPGFISAFTEIWINCRPCKKPATVDDSNFSDTVAETNKVTSIGWPIYSPISDRIQEKTHLEQDPFETLDSTIPLVPPDARIIEFSPSIRTFNEVRSHQRRDYSVAQVPALLTAMTCHHSSTIHSTATDGLWRFLLKADKVQHAEAIGIITTCIALVVPSGLMGLIDPSSSIRSAHWILRMNIIDRTVFENERSGDYARLRRLQQHLLDNLIGAHLGCSLSTHDSKFTLKVLMPVVRVSTLVSFQFPILRVRLIFDRNVRKMSKMLIDAADRKDIDLIDRDRFIIMMLIMSDFKCWTNPNDDEQWLHIWDTIDEDQFLLYGLPCWFHTLSDATTKAVVEKLESIFDANVTKFLAPCPPSESEGLKRKLSYILDWMTHFAWNSVEQVTCSSYQSLYTSYFLALIFKRPGQSIYIEAPNYNKKSAVELKPVYKQEDKHEPQFTRQKIIFDQDVSHQVIHLIDTTRQVQQQYPTLESTLSSSIPADDVPSTSPDALSRHTLNVGTTQALIPSSGLEMLDDLDAFAIAAVATQPHHDQGIAMDVSPSSSSSSSSQNPAQFSTSLNKHYLVNDMNIWKAINTLENIDPTNPEGHKVIRRIFKYALAARDLWGFVKSHLDSSVSKLYIPNALQHGTPESDDLCFFQIPKETFGVAYHESSTSIQPIAPPAGSAPVQPVSENRYNCIRTYLESEIQLNQPNAKFTPITLAASNHPLCNTIAPYVEGTTGMAEIRVVDSGDTNDIILGITWDLKSYAGRPHDLATLIPGSTPTSIGLIVSTGNVRYLDPQTGAQVETPYVAPSGSTSKICIGIAHRKVFFIVDNTFYPPIPDFMLPSGCNLHAVARLGCLGIKLTMRALARKWTEERSSDGLLLLANHNPIAHALHLSKLRTKVCPHYHAHRRPDDCRPSLVSYDVGAAKYDGLPSDMQNLIRFIQLANIPCAIEECQAPGIIRSIIKAITSAPV